MKKEKGITLVALIITIIVILLIAGVGIYFATDILNKAKLSKFIDEMKKVDEQVALKILEGETEKITNPELEIFSQAPTGSDWTNINSGLKYEIAYNRDKKEGTAEEKLPTGEYYKDYEFKENTEGKIEDIFYVDKELTARDEKAYLYDGQSESVYRIEPEVIEGIPVHGAGLGNLIIGDSGLLRTNAK